MSIGFKYAGKHLPEVSPSPTLPKGEGVEGEGIPLIDDMPQAQRKAIADRLLQQEGMSQAIQLLYEYFSNAYLPLIQGSNRDEMYIDKLRKIKERYFEPI